MALEKGAMQINISKDVEDIREELIALRRQIHRRPELGFEEHQTQALILETLTRYGIPTIKLGKTGVAAMIEGRNEGPVVLLRGDMDALPVEEQCDVPWKSEHRGVMHACGHDAHTAMMLAAAKILSRRGIAEGAVKILFQPAEEGGGGAQVMVDEGVLDKPRVDAAVGFHVWSGFDTGTVAVLEGPVTASVDGFRITVRGKGTHAATPEAGVDPMFIAAQIVTAAQGLVTRRIRAMDPVVLSFTGIQGGSTFNVIRLSKNIAESFDAKVEYDTTTETRPMIADKAVARAARREAEAVVGPDGIINPGPLMVGEDFADIIARVPGAFVKLGCRNEKVGAVYPHHHPLFTIDEEVLPIGVEVAVRIAESLLNKVE